MPSDRPFRVVRLSHVNDPGRTPIFPGDPAFTLDTVATIAEDGYYLQAVSQGEHTGTHWGAPAHFTAGGLTADQLDADDLFLPAVKIDVRAGAASDADFALSIDDVLEWEHEHGALAPESAVILWTGWESRWGTPAYANLDDLGTMHQPGFGIDAVEWLLDRGVLGVRGALGIDTFGPDRGIDGDYAVSKLLYHEHRISLENLTNLGQLPTTGAYVLAGGTMNRAGSGSAATIYGLISRPDRWQSGFMDQRDATSHEQQSGKPWDESYQHGPAPWDIGRPQSAIVRVAESGGLAGPVLDAGTGTGENALHLASLGFAVVGVDVAETALRMARTKAAERGLDTQFVQADALALDRLGRTFASAIDSGLFHTFNAAERNRYALSLASVIEPGGTLYVLCFSDEGEHLGPHPVSPNQIRAAFGEHWRVAAIQPEQIETRLDDQSFPAWLVTVRRV